MIVIDASLTIDLSLGTQTGHELWPQVESTSATLAAPDLIDLEILQVLRRQLNLKIIDIHRANEAIAVFNALPIDRYSHHLLAPRIWALRDNLTAYDAAYFALSELLDIPLCTRDKKFLTVPEHYTDIHIF